MRDHLGINFSSWNIPAGELLREAHLNRARFGVVAAVGLLAITQGWISPHRPSPSDLSGATSFRVTSAGDHGAGTLREAILSADRAGRHARIDMLVNRVVLTAPLPPIINPSGISISSGTGQCAIDGSQLTSGNVLEVRSKAVDIEGIRIENAAQNAIQITAPGLKVSGSSFTNCNTAIEVAQGGGDLVVEDSTFEKNHIGIEADNFEHAISVRKCRFFSQSQAGIWAVGQPTSDSGQLLDIGRNQFSDNRFGVVAANHQVRIHDNEMVLSREAAIQLFDRGAIVEHNRIADGLGSGVQADSTIGLVIADNEIYRNRTVAILLKNSSDGMVRKNSIYQNGNGIAFVFGRSSNPNSAVQNTIFSQLGDAIVVAGQQPVMENNVVRSNNTGGGSSIVVPVSATTSLKPTSLTRTGPASTTPDPSQAHHISSTGGTEVKR